MIAQILQLALRFRGVFITSLIGLLLKLASPKIIATFIVLGVEWVLRRTKWKWLERVLFTMYDEWEVKRPEPNQNELI